MSFEQPHRLGDRVVLNCNAASFTPLGSISWMVIDQKIDDAVDYSEVFLFATSNNMNTFVRKSKLLDTPNFFLFRT